MTGRPPAAGIPSREELVRLYVTERKSLRAISEEVGIPKDAIARALVRYEIPKRSPGRISRLSTHRSGTLEKRIDEKGLRKAAKELKVSHVTLLRHLQRRLKRALK
jgi:predicted ArsR family transcriptional regulator